MKSLLEEIASQQILRDIAKATDDQEVFKVFGFVCNVSAAVPEGCAFLIAQKSMALNGHPENLTH